MPNSCKKSYNLLPDYLDGLLNDRDRLKFENHLSLCAKCREELNLQREWLNHSSLLSSAHAERAVPEGLGDRIKAAIRAESPVSPKVRPVSGVFRKFASLPGLAGAAAAILVLVIALQAGPYMIPGGRQASLENSSLTEAGGSQQETNASTYAVTSDAAAPNSDDFSVWHTVKTFSTALVDGQTAAEDCLGNFKAETLSKLDIILNEASDIRYASRSGPAPQTLILAAYGESDVKLTLERIKNVLSTCETPVQIEIIRTDELADRLDEIDTALYALTFPESSPESSWILILLGA